MSEAKEAAKRPTGFVAKCRCGSVTGAVDTSRMLASEASKMIGEWLLGGKTVIPMFGSWNVELSSCKCVGD